MWCLMVTVVSECLAEGLGLSNAVTSLVLALYLSGGLQALCPFWEVPQYFPFLRKSASVRFYCLHLGPHVTACLHHRTLSLSPFPSISRANTYQTRSTVLTRHHRHPCHHICYLKNQQLYHQAIKLYFQGSEQETEIPP